MFLRSSVVVAALAAGAAPALAAGLDQPAASPVVAAPVVVAPAAPMMADGDWTGAYAGAQLSFGNVSSDLLVDEYDGELYGLVAGYQRDFGRFVLGGEASYDWTSITVDELGADLDSVARLGLRAGYDGGRFLPYATVGLARAVVSGGGDDVDLDGVYYGLGVDYAVTDSITAGAVFLQHDFDELDGAELADDVSAGTFGLRVAYNF